MKIFAVAGLIALAAASAFAQQKLPAAVGEEIAAGTAVSGVPCKLRAVAPSREGVENWQIPCEGWERPSIFLFRAVSATKADVNIREAEWVKRLTDTQYLCEDPQPRRLLGDVEAFVRACKLRDGGWPSFILAARVGDKLVGANGLPDGLPALETALALMAGKPPSAGAGGAQGLQDYNVKLLQETLGAGFKNVGLQDMSSARNYARLTNELNNMGDFEASIEVNQRWLELLERVNGRDSPNNAYAMSFMALNYGRATRWQESEEMEKRVAPLLERAPDRNWLPLDMSFRAGLALQRGNSARAKQLAEEAIKYRRERLGQVRGPALALAYFRAGQVYRATNDRPEAERYLRDALTAYQGIYGNVHFWVANTRKELGGVLGEAGKNAEAETELREAVRQLEIVHGDRRTTVWALMELGGFLTRAKRGEEALAVYRKAAGHAAKNRRDRPQMRVATLAPYYFALASGNAPVDGARAEEVFTGVQIPMDPVVGQAVTLMSARIADTDPSVRDLARQLQDANDELTKLRSRLGRADGQEEDSGDAKADGAIAGQVRAAAEKIDRLEAQLQAAQPRYARLTNPPPMKVAEASKFLRPGEALVVTLTAFRTTYVVLVRDGQATGHVTGLGQRDLEQAIDGLRKGVDWARLGPQDFDLAASHALYAKLFGPLEAKLAGVKHLILVAGGPLASLPPALLVRRPPTAGDYAGAAWLMNDMAVSVLPAVSSLAALRQTAKPSTAKQPFIGFGDPRFGGVADASGASLAALGKACRVTADERADPQLLQALAPLPETADEIKAMAASLKAPADSVVLGAAASEAEIRKRDLSRYRVVAFATHGLLPGELPCQNEPALAFTPGRGQTAADDGLLNASEIARLKLDADWVVLSACNTAGPDGTARGGQALSGLVRAFLYAGSRAVLATHWAVASEPTVTLTTGTFAAFAKPGTGRAEALRQAQLAMLKDPKTQHPVFWAPFVVVGEGAR